MAITRILTHQAAISVIEDCFHSPIIRFWPRILVSIACVMLVSDDAIAQWDFQFRGEFGAIYTDNLRLADSGAEEEEIVYSVAPTFTLISDSERITADIRYRPELYIYEDAPESDAIYHVVDATSTTTLIRDAFFVYLGASRFQTTGSPEGGFLTSNIPITGTRVDSTVLEARPYWEQNLGFADVLAEISYRESIYDGADDLVDSSLLQDNSEESGRFDLNNHFRQEGLAWGVNYEYRKIEYDQAFPFEYQFASANLGYWVNRTLRVFGAGGRETPIDSLFDSSMDAEFWEAGVQYTPNQRLDFEFAAGERSFGKTVRGRFNYRLRRGSTTLSYVEGAATRAEIGYSRRPIFFTDNLDSVLDSPGFADRFLRRRGEWQTTIGLAKSDATLRLFWEGRDERTSDAGDPLDDEEFAGVAFRWAWRLGTKTTFGFSADVSRRSVGDDDSDLSRLALDYGYQFTQKLGISLLAQRSEEEGGVASFRGNYVENQFRVMFRVVVP